MKTCPADIFIYGVEKSTSVQDIIDDLKESGIDIEHDKVEKKTREPATVDSYKISVKNEDLQTALDPAIWPMRVKVREWIYYPKKKSKKTQHQKDGKPQFGKGRHSAEQPVNSNNVRGHVTNNARPRAVSESASYNVTTNNRFVIPAFRSGGSNIVEPMQV